MFSIIPCGIPRAKDVGSWLVVILTDCGELLMRNRMPRDLPMISASLELTWLIESCFAITFVVY